MRILIVRSSAIGDVVFASALPAAIRRAHPDAHIAWLVEPGIHELLLPDPAIDEVITWSKAEWVKLWKSGRKLELLGRVRQFRRELHARRFDVALDLQGLLKSGFLTWLSGAPRRVGLGSKEGSQWLMSEVIPRGGEKARIGSEYQYLAQQMGFDAGDFLPTLTLAPETEAAAARKLEAHGLQAGRFAVQTRLPEAAAVIARAALLIGVDTGLTHMGTALAQPTVAIFGSTCPYQDTGRPTGSVIWLGMPCSPCRRRPTCGGKFTCLRDITPERVLAEAQAMLAAERTR